VIGYVSLVDRLFSDLFVAKSLLLILSIGTYGAFSVLINDYFDMPYDLLAGKKRTIYEIPKRYIHFMLTALLLICSSTVVAIANSLYSAIYVIMLVLSILYSAPVFRFKERGRAAIAVDVLIEKTMPTALVFIAFDHIAPDVILLLALASCLHLEMILHHQAEDCEMDKRVGIRTLVSEGLGVKQTLGVLDRYVRPVTTLLFLVFCLVLVQKIPMLLFAYAAMTIVFLIMRRSTGTGTIVLEDKLRPFYFGCVAVMNDNVMPLLITICLVLLYPPYLPVMVVTLLAQSERYGYFAKIIVKAF